MTKNEFRRPKFEIRNANTWQANGGKRIQNRFGNFFIRLPQFVCLKRLGFALFRTFGVRFSDFGLLSVFGFRNSDFLSSCE
jgi:hypothetical protein